MDVFEYCYIFVIGSLSKSFFMETKKLNLCEILKDCPEGTMLYSPFLGTVFFGYIDEDYKDITVIDDKDNRFTFDSQGVLLNAADGECCLFPSKKNRDWNTWKNPKPKVKRFDPRTLKPFDKVLTRDEFNYVWCPSLFGYMVENDAYPCRCCDDNYRYCIPYNDDTKHLVGTTDEAPVYYRYWEE